MMMMMVQTLKAKHGPSEEQGCCRDEINLIKPLGNYGWRIIKGSETKAGLETPIYHSGDTTTWAPTGGVFITQGEWKGSLLFTGLRGEALYRAVFNSADPFKIDTVERTFIRNLAGYIFIDINMPVITGDKVLRILRTKWEFDSIPITVLSTSMSLSEAERYKRDGANFTFQMPNIYNQYHNILKTIFALTR